MSMCRIINKSYVNLEMNMLKTKYFENEMKKERLRADRTEADNSQQTKPSSLGYKFFSFMMPTDPQETSQEKQSQQIRMISKS